MRKRDFWLLSATSLAVLNGTGHAGAQPASADEPVSYDTIIVTAQKREQRLTDVPIAITAFSGDQLRDRAVTELSQVTDYVPNVEIFRTNTGQPTWIIRGVGLIDFNPNNTPVAAVFQDEIYGVSNTIGQLSLFDVDRIEILKGPQGALYGRNTTGGAIQVISRRPDLQTTQADITARYEEHDRVFLEGGVSIPVIEDRLAVRLAGQLDQSDGAWQELVSTGEEYGRRDKWALRGSVLAKPTDNTTLTVLIDGGQDQSENNLDVARGVYDPLDPNLGFCDAVLNGQLDNDSCTTYGGQVNALLGFPGTNDPSDQSGDGKRVLADPFGELDIETLGVTAIGEVDLGAMTLTSITGWRDFDYGRSSDSDGVTGEFGHSEGVSAFDIFSQEIRLQSNDAGRLNWLVGATYARDDLSEERFFLARDNIPLFLTNSFGLYGVAAPDQLVTRIAYDQESDSYALFGQFDYQIIDNVTVDLGVRYTDEEKTYENGGLNFPLATGPVSPFVAQNANFELKDEYDLGEHWSGRASVNYSPTEDVLTYASVARGVKTGGFFGGFPARGQESVVPYLEETVWSYELGFKSSFDDNRLGLNGAVFYYDYSDVQNFRVVFSELLNGPTQQLANIGDARHVGAELDGFWRPTRPLFLAASVGYLDAEYTSDVAYITFDGQPASYEGQSRPFAPEWSWSVAASYDVQIGQFGALRLAADANGRTDLSRSFGSLFDQAHLGIDGYTLVNARVAYFPNNGNWEIAAYGRNILDENYVLTPNVDGLGSFTEFRGQDSVYGLELRWEL